MIRRTFIASTALAAATVPAVAAAAAPVGQPAPAAAFNRAAFEAILAKPYRHRQVVAAVKIDGGQPLDFMHNTMEAYEKGFGEGPGTVHTIAVLYHGAAIALAFAPELWVSYKIAAAVENAPFSEKLDLEKAIAGNPYADGIAKLVAAGSTFFVCDNALHGVSGYLAHVMKREPAAVYGELTAGLLPGTMIVPAGVAAIDAAQAAKFTLLQASL